MFNFELLRGTALLTLAGGICALLTGCPRASENSEFKVQNSKLLLPSHGIYTGAYIDWGDKEDAVTIEGIEDFEKLVGKHQPIVASSSYWGEQTFPEANVRLIANH